MRDVKLRGVKEDDYLTAISVVKKFTKAYPDRNGFSAGVVYSSALGFPSFYVYRTKTTITASAYYGETK